jgi:hypothetical protein
MNAREIVQKIRNQSKPLSPAETRNIMEGIRADVQADLNATLVGALTYYRAHTLSRELEKEIDGAQMTTRTAAVRFNELHQAVSAADLALRQAKADRIMLPGSAPPSDLAAADRAIQEAGRALRKAEGNLRTAKGMAEKRQRELDNMRAMHRALSAIKLPDMTALRVLLDAVEHCG